MKQIKIMETYTKKIILLNFIIYGSKEVIANSLYGMYI